MVSVIVPTKNEEANIKNLILLLAQSLKKLRDYEIVVVDDFSTDGTWETLNDLAAKYPLKISRKVGKKGKAYSLVQGFQIASGEILAMIDADLQYPPEAIPEMIAGLNADTDIVVANRKRYQDRFFRKILSRGFRSVFGKLLFDLNCDVQSGLKVMKKEVWQTVKFAPRSAWTFDLEFLHRAQLAGYKIKNIDITFYPRHAGRSSLSKIKTTIELAANAISLKLKKVPPLHIAPESGNTMLKAGIGYRRQKYITHSTLPHHRSALTGLVLWQKLLLASILALLTFGLFASVKITAIITVAVLSTVYFIDLLFNLYLILRSLHFPPEITFSNNELSTLPGQTTGSQEPQVRGRHSLRVRDSSESATGPAAINHEQLPIYSILCPLYKESSVLPQFISSIENLSWPKNKLDVILLLEEDDLDTQDAAKKLDLPSYVRTLIVPHTNPKTKPKACNFGLAHALGEYAVVYDAEDRPDPDQLKKAYLAFQKLPRNVVCLQAKLNYYNPNHNLLTRLFTAEYSLWFDVILTGLQSIKTIIPLGGTSNHFRTADLIALHGWDAFNVTEDADLGARLFKLGGKTAVIDSTTQEEANSNFTNWLRQRSRWIKGYMQTYLVHMRDPLAFIKTHGLHAIFFQLVVGGKIAFMFINPFLWVATIAYFALNHIVGSAIEAIYPAPVFYMAATSLVFGNFLFLYYYMIGLAKRGQWHLVKYVFFVPFYWLAVSFAATISLYQLIAKPHYWEKTIHGFHLDKVKSDLAKEQQEQRKQQERDLEAAAREERFRKIKALAGSGVATGTALVAATVIANFLNFVYNAYLGRSLSVEEFGLISLVGSFFFLSGIPLGALSKTVTYRTAYLLGKYQVVPRQFWVYVRKRAILAGILACLAWLALVPFLSDFFNSKSIEPFLIFTPVWLVGLVAAVDRSFIGGNLRFKIAAFILVIETVFKLFLTWLFVSLGLAHYVYGAIPASMIVALLIAWIFAGRIVKNNRDTDKPIPTTFPLKFFITSILAIVATVAFLSFDIILAKHYLAPDQAGQYALLSWLGKLIFFVGGLFGQFIVPLVSREEGAKRNSKALFYKLFLASSATSFLAYLVIGVAAPITAPLILNSKAAPVIDYLPVFGLAIFCFTVATSVVSYYQVRKKYLFAYVSFILAVIQAAGIVLHHANLAEIVQVMTSTGVVYLAIIIFLHIIYEPLAALGRNLIDFASLITFSAPKVTANPANLRVLIFNWRDMRHVWGGGAEVYLHEIAKNLVKDGHAVTVFCGNDGSSPRSEVIDGVRIVRHGGFYTVYVWAAAYYLLHFRKNTDIVIDSENGIPFFTPLYVKQPVIGIVHHVHQEVFRKHLFYPMAKLAQFLEGKLMPLVYRNVKMITVSNSSKVAMEAIGLGRLNPIEIIHPGINPKKYKPREKAQNPRVLYLGRLKPYKSIETVIYAITQVIKSVPNAALTIAGDGESKDDLQSLVKKLGLQDVVTFTGRVSEKVKAKLLAKSWVMVQPSSMEGFGITAIEANASGTPVIASNIPGLRDSVNNPHSGILVPHGDVAKFAQKIELVLTDKKTRRQLEKGARQWAQNFSWQKSSQDFMAVIKGELVKNPKLFYSPDQVSSNVD